MTDDVEKVTYKKAIVSFIDILGFRGLVEENKEDSSAVLKVLEVFKKTQGLGIFSSEKEERNIMYFFSDSVVRVRECFPNDGVVFFEELRRMSVVQTVLLKHGILIRGGLTYGDIFFNEDTVFGPAMIRAYQLESQYADFPRLIVDSEFANNFINDFKEHVKTGRVKRDRDGFYMLDIFKYIVLFEEEYTGFSMNKMKENIKFHIEENLIKFRGNERVVKKYYWLSDYYNKVFSKEGFHIDTERLLAE